MQYHEFPEFVPDQLLLSDHLNQVFNYLDEQERLTRSCLIGVGIVCGLEVETNGTGTAITITEGCGITTEGYLIQVPATTYTEYVAYDAVKPRYYDRFVDIGAKQKKFDLYELVQSGVVEASVPLTDAFITDKVVLLFVELLEEQSKNCDPNSCDDKGVEVTVTFRPLLVSKTDAAALVAGAGGGAKLSGDLLKLQELRMPRVDVPATSLADTAAVFGAFLTPFTAKFLEMVQKDLSKAYSLLKDLVVDNFPANPFANLAHNYRFLVTQTMTADQLMNVQYYYDLFSDLLLSYDELRRAGACVGGECCPADDFPRHLLLGEAKSYSQYAHSDYRHYFIPSPILAKQPCLLAELRSILIRMALLVSRFSVPAISKTGGKLAPEFVGITPSTLGEVPLGRKAIPFYYAVIKTPNPLYTYWDQAKTRASAANKNLSYHAMEYNTADDFVRHPLLYDLEPYNFLRIEGHVGQSYTDSLASIQLQRNKYRLPIEVIALSTDTRRLLAELRGSGVKDITETTRAGCYFRDLESLYAALEKHLICFLCKEMKYYYALPAGAGPAGATTLVPTAALLKRCDPSFRYAPSTYGQLFEDWYGNLKNLPYLPTTGILAASGYETYKPLFFGMKAGAAGTPATEAAVAPAEIADVPIREVQMAFINQSIRFILYYIERLSETLSGSLATIDITTFQSRFDDLQNAARAYKDVLAGNTQRLPDLKTEELLDHLDKLIYACDPSEFRSLAAEFEKRWRALEALRHFAYYARKCPGLQHKAGVSMGGTFVLVYHENTRAGASLNDLKKGAAGDRILEELVSNFKTNKGKIEELVGNIPDGTVIADFYFPFICCSDCPPVHFEVAASGSPPATDAPTISITPTEFCNGDPGPFAITVSPAGGTIGGDGAGSDGGSGFSFAPDKVDVGDNSVKQVQLTYASSGATASVTVKVYHEPTADFRVVQNPGTGPGHVDTVDQSKFADSYSWDFGDGTPAVTTPKAAHNYQQPGKYSITLTVKNGACSAQKVVPVTIEFPRLCLPVKTLSDEFKNLSALDPSMFAPFRKAFTPPFADIAAFFKDFAAAGDMSPADEIKFHVSHKTASALAAWQRQLAALITEQKQFRTLAFELYRILTGVAMRVACFQDEDISAAKVPMQAVFKLIISETGQWKNFAADTLPPAKLRIKRLASDVQTETDRLKADEKADKPNYASALNALGNILRGYPF